MGERITAKLEYLYARFDDDIFSETEDGRDEFAEIDDVHFIKAGVNYHFDW